MINDKHHGPRGVSGAHEKKVCAKGNLLKQ